MKKLNITGKQIRAIGFPEGPVVSVAMNTMNTHFKHRSEEDALQILKEILNAPDDYLADELLGKIAEKLTASKGGEHENPEITMRELPA